jgi:hypothetical protein
VKWGRDYVTKGHNIVTTEPTMFPNGWDYVQETFTKTKVTPTPNQDASETNANAYAPIINNTAVVKSSDIEEKKEQKKLADKKRSLFFVANKPGGMFDLDAFKPVKAVVAPTFMGPFKKASSYSTTATAGLVQSVVHGAFERKSCDTALLLILLFCTAQSSMHRPLSTATFCMYT